MVDQLEQLTQDRVADHYESLRYALPWAAVYHTAWIEDMVAAAEYRPGLRVLDAGCGTGQASRHVVADDYFGFDLSAGMLEKARSAAPRLTQCDCCDLPYAEASFDVVLARSLLHHLRDPDPAVRELRRVLKPGGVLVVTDTNRSLISDLPRRIAYRSDSFSDAHTNLHRRELVDLLARHLRVDRVRHFGYLAYPLGFPDMMGPLRKLPAPRALTHGLMAVDRLIARVPGVRTQSWGILVRASVPAS